MCIDHGCARILVAEQLLDGLDVRPGFEKVRGEGVSQDMGRDPVH